MSFYIELVTVVIELSLLFYFFHNYFEDIVPNAARKLISMLCEGVCLLILSCFVSISFLRFVITISFTLLWMKIFCAKPWREMIFPISLFFVATMVSDIILGMLLQFGGFSLDALLGNGFERIIYNSMGKLIHLLCLYMVLSFKQSNSFYIAIYRILPILSCQLISFYVCHKSFIAFSLSSNQELIILSCLSLLYINIVLCVYVDILNRSYIKQKEAIFARQQMEAREEYYHDLVVRQEETRALWHDIKKYMATMESLVSNENQKEAKQCLAQVHEAFSHIEASIDTGNVIIDSILAYGMKKAHDFGVSINLQIWIGIVLNIPASDLFIIIGNTLDNAIEACSVFTDPELRQVSLSLHQMNHVLFYEVKNRYCMSRKRKAGSVHGYGLNNVHTCVERNEGSMSITRNDGEFVVSIRLNV